MRNKVTNPTLVEKSLRETLFGQQYYPRGIKGAKERKIAGGKVKFTKLYLINQRNQSAGTIDKNFQRTGNYQMCTLSPIRKLQNPVFSRICKPNLLPQIFAAKN